MEEPLFIHEDTGQFIIEDNLAKVYPELTKKELLKWLATAPEATYLRVNTLKTSIQSLIDRILGESKIAGKILMKPHDILDDVIVVTKVDSAGDCTQLEDLTKSRDDVIPVIVGSGCGTSVLRGADVFAPGVIGTLTYLEKGDKVSVYADLRNKLLKGATKFDIEDYLYVGRGMANLSRQSLFKDHISSGIAVTMTSASSKSPRINDEQLSEMKELYFMQNLPSILTTYQLEIDPNDRCLDMCAAPGGKTTHIASLLGLRGHGRVIALDRSKPKIEQINRNGSRLGLSDKIEAFVQDATKAQFEAESFDKILLDGPCSALGQRPMLVQAAKVKELKSFPKLQKKLFDKAVELLKPGGILVYSTCTVTTEENEAIVKWALDKYSSILDLCQTHPVLGQPGCDILDADLQAKVQRFGPGDQMSTIGYFLAKFKKLY
jgi:16S rRNA C967 or C1407 C5-methylase (RsmB/RsmF family)